MRPHEIARLRDEYLYATRDEEEMAAWAKRSGAALILVIEQLADSLAFWVDRSDRFERRLNEDLPSADAVMGILSTAYATGRTLVPESNTDKERP